DSVHGFHFFWPARPLRGHSHTDSRSVRLRELALGVAPNCDHAGSAVLGKTETRRANRTPRDLAGCCVCILAVGHRAGVRRYRRPGWMAVLLDTDCLSLAPGAGEGSSAVSPQPAVWFSWHFLHHVPGVGRGFLSPRQCHHCPENFRFPGLLVLLSHHLRWPHRPLPSLCRRLEKKANSD